MIFINSSKQRLYYFEKDVLIFESTISTSVKGMGCLENSFKTPTGLHIIASKIGEGHPIGTLFKNRKPTTRIIKNIPDDDNDYITSRIMRLSGLEDGINKGSNVDSYDRYIYIHGTPYTNKLGTRQSQGCIRMSDMDVVKLFSLVDINTLVLID